MAFLHTITPCQAEAHTQRGELTIVATWHVVNHEHYTLVTNSLQLNMAQSNYVSCPIKTY